MLGTNVCNTSIIFTFHLDSPANSNQENTAMFRLWAKEFKDNRMLRDIVIEDNTQETRTHKVYNSIEKISYAFDLGNPLWLDKNIKEFKRHDKTRFTQDNFIEPIAFDYLEIHVIEED